MLSIREEYKDDYNKERERKIRTFSLSILCAFLISSFNNSSNKFCFLSDQRPCSGCKEGHEATLLVNEGYFLFNVLV